MRGRGAWHYILYHINVRIIQLQLTQLISDITKYSYFIPCGPPKKQDYKFMFPTWSGPGYKTVSKYILI